MKLISTIALALLATPVAAQEGTLWRNVTADMSRADLMALYPEAKGKRHIALDRVNVAGSDMAVTAEMDKATDRVAKITLTGGWVDSWARLQSDLTTKYGKPETATCESVDIRENCMAVWKSGKTMITMEIIRKPDFGTGMWRRIVYAPVVINDNL